MKLWFISDTHCKHDRLEVPDADAVIHCGNESTHGNAWMNEPEARKFFEWYSARANPFMSAQNPSRDTSLLQSLTNGDPEFIGKAHGGLLLVAI